MLELIIESARHSYAHSETLSGFSGSNIISLISTTAFYVVHLVNKHVQMFLGRK